MTDYFAGYEIIAQTKNFLVTSEADPGARQRAGYIAQSCENDLARLNDLFSTNFEAGNTSPHPIWVIVLVDDPSANFNGLNYGYETKESSRIYIRRAFVPPPPQPPSPFPPDPLPLPGPDLNEAIIQFPLFVFVAELAEIMMGFTGYGWDAGHSPGEGLSNVLGALLHPAGYYDSGSGPRINLWLNGQTTPSVIAPRTDYVTYKLDTDKDEFSYGCAILFINYLVFQLRFPLKTVIRAGGSTLGETFARLTGDSPGSGFNDFNALLQAHIGSSTTNYMLRDNIFPLLDVPFRSIEVTEPAFISKGEFTETQPTPFNVKPGSICAVATYSYFRHDALVEQPIYVRVQGTANAAISWGIEGFEAGETQSGVWTTGKVATPLTIKNPDGSEVIVAEEVTVQFAVGQSWNAWVVYFRTPESNGNYTLNLTFSAREAAYPNEAVVSATDTPSLTTVTWIPGADAIRAFQRCNPIYGRLTTSFWYLSSALAAFKNRPRPFPDPVYWEVDEIIRAVESLQKSVAQYARAGHLTEAEVFAGLGLPGVLRSQDPAPSELDLTRLLPTRTGGPSNCPSGFASEEEKHV